MHAVFKQKCESLFEIASGLSRDLCIFTKGRDALPEYFDSLNRIVDLNPKHHRDQQTDSIERNRVWCVATTRTGGKQTSFTQCTGVAKNLSRFENEPFR